MFEIRDHKNLKRNASALPGVESARGYEVDETYWGYIIRSTERPSALIGLLQGVSFLFGLALLIATMGLWIVPGSITGGAAVAMKFGMTVFTGGASIFCLWFASRGTLSEVHIDTRLAEVREVVRNKAGRASLIGRYGFDAINEVAIDTPDEENRAAACALVLRQRGTHRILQIARGNFSALSELQDRLGGDLMLRAREALASPYKADGTMARWAMN